MGTVTCVVCLSRCGSSVHSLGMGDSLPETDSTSTILHWTETRFLDPVPDWMKEDPDIVSMVVEFRSQIERYIQLQKLVTEKEELVRLARKGSCCSQGMEPGL